MSPEDANALLVPRLSANEDVVTVSRMFAAPGQAVQAGDIVLSLTTTKVDVDVEAPGDGFFWPLVEVGDQVEVGTVAARISASRERPIEIDRSEGRCAMAPRATRKAIDRAAELGVDLGALPVGKGIIRERDVEAYHARSGGSAAVRGATPRSGHAVPAAGKLDPEFLAAIREPASGFRQLASDLKVMLYRRHGAIIGESVSFEPGAAIFADSIELGSGCQFGADTLIVAETLKLGVGCLFGRSNDIVCRRIEIGDVLFLAHRVVIGQGGAFNPESELVIGHSCLVSSDCLINTAHRVSMGDRSCLSPKASIYTHSHWQNVLEGYQATCLPVTIGNDVWITGGSLIAPGTVMEDGSQALANSAVSGVVPLRTIVWGVPARPVGKVRGDLSLAEREAIMQGIWPEVEDALRHAGLDSVLASYTGSQPDGRLAASVQVAFAARPASYEGTFFDLLDYQVTGPDTPVADVVRNVLRKHGIRFEPHLWRYRADVGRFNA
jgi:acetyltransferase-like isoleucine patch superfamily enzyme